MQKSGGRRPSRRKIRYKKDFGVTDNNRETFVARTPRAKGRVVETEVWKGR